MAPESDAAAGGGVAIVILRQIESLPLEALQLRKNSGRVILSICQTITLITSS